MEGIRKNMWREALHGACSECTQRLCAGSVPKHAAQRMCARNVPRERAQGAAPRGARRNFYAQGVGGTENVCAECC